MTRYQEVDCVQRINREQISVLTSVCVALVYPNGTMQLD